METYIKEFVKKLNDNKISNCVKYRDDVDSVTVDVFQVKVNIVIWFHLDLKRVLINDLTLRFDEDINEINTILNQIFIKD